MESLSKSKLFNSEIGLFAILLIGVLIVFIVQERKKVNRNEKRKPMFLVLLLSFLIVSPAYILINASIQSFTNKNRNIPFIEFGEHYENLPNYLVFFATAISAYLLYNTLVAQRKASQITSFESRLFKFIDYHRDNVDKLRYRKPYCENSEKDNQLAYSFGKEFFIILSNEMWDMLDNYGKSTFDLKGQNSIPYDKINFIYSCLFYGAWEDKINLLKMKLKCSDDDLRSIGFDKIAKYSSKSSEKLLSGKTWKKQPYPYYTGHVNRLGNYFRNIYQAIKYIDGQDDQIISVNEKYEYSKHFRAQFSAYEQSILFYNALSDLGKSWEHEHYSMNADEAWEKKETIFTKLLITKYDLLRNAIWVGEIGCIYQSLDYNFKLKISDFFPLHCSEHEEECSISGVLPFKYSNKEKHSICRMCFNKIIGYNDIGVKQKLLSYFTQERLNNDVFAKEKLKEFRCNVDGCECIDTVEILQKQFANEIQ